MGIEQRRLQSEVGDSICQLSRDALDEPMESQPPQIVSGPARGTLSGQCRKGAVTAAELPRAYYPWQDR